METEGPIKKEGFNSLLPGGDFNEIVNECFLSQLQWLVAEIPAVKLPSEECI